MSCLKRYPLFRFLSCPKYQLFAAITCRLISDCISFLVATYLRAGLLLFFFLYLHCSFVLMFSPFPFIVINSTIQVVLNQLFPFFINMCFNHHIVYFKSPKKSLFHLLKFDISFVLITYTSL